MTGVGFLGVAMLSISAALCVVAARNLLFAAVCLMGLLATTAVAYVLLGASFLAGMQILVYVGGTVVLILFAIMLTHSPEMTEARTPPIRNALAALVSLGFLGVSLTAVTSLQLPAGSHLGMEDMGNQAMGLGRVLLSAESGGFVIPLELISVLLLSALIGGIVLARSKSAQGGVHGG